MNIERLTIINLDFFFIFVEKNNELISSIIWICVPSSSLATSEN